MSDFEISIIIPIYNSSNYLRRCLDSILFQTFDRWECILVDDGSTDGSSIICDEYVSKDERFKVIHQANSGVSKARNVGINIAKGNWIGFVDSDDWIESETYEIAYNEAIKNNADMVQWGYCRSDGEHDFAFCVYKNDFNLSKFTDNLKEDEPYFGFILTLTKRDLLLKNNIFFPTDMSMGEDYIFSLKCYLSAKNIYNIKNKCFYHYFQNPNSACHSTSEKNKNAQIYFITKFEKMIKETEYKESLLCIVNRQKAGFKIKMLQEKNYISFRENFREINKMILSKFKKYTLAIIFVNLHLDFLANMYLDTISFLGKIKRGESVRG